MAAINATCLTLLEAGQHVVVSRNVFGATMTLFSKVLSKFGVEVTFVDDMTDLDAWRASVRSSTRLLFVESPSNPHVEIADLTALADIAHQNSALLVVDNAMCTPALQ